MFADIYCRNLLIKCSALIFAFLYKDLGNLVDFHIDVLYLHHQCFHHTGTVWDVISGRINSTTATEQEVISLIGALAVKPLHHRMRASDGTERGRHKCCSLEPTSQVSSGPRFSFRSEKAVIAGLHKPTSNPWECFRDCIWIVSGLLMEPFDKGIGSIAICSPRTLPAFSSCDTK